MEHNIDNMGMNELRDSLADVAERAKLGTPTVVLNRGKRSFAIVPVEVLDAYIANQTRELRELIRSREDKPTRDLTEVLDEAVAAVQDQGEPR